MSQILKASAGWGEQLVEKVELAAAGEGEGLLLKKKEKAKKSKVSTAAYAVNCTGQYSGLHLSYAVNCTGPCYAPTL